MAAAFLVLTGGLAGPASAQVQVPDAVQAEYMVKNSLVALNQANITGNYTVLRDLGSLRFRAGNNAARLAAVFARFRDEGIDLAPIVVFQPQFAAEAGLDEEGRLRLVGQFPTRPLRIVFDIFYELTGNGWLLSDMAVSPVPWPEETGNGEEQGQSSEQSPAPLAPTQLAPSPPAASQPTAPEQPRQPTSQLPVPRPRPVQ